MVNVRGNCPKIALYQVVELLQLGFAKGLKVIVYFPIGNSSLLGNL